MANQRRVKKLESSALGHSALFCEMTIRVRDIVQPGMMPRQLLWSEHDQFNFRKTGRRRNLRWLIPRRSDNSCAASRPRPLCFCCTLRIEHREKRNRRGDRGKGVLVSTDQGVASTASRNRASSEATTGGDCFRIGVESGTALPFNQALICEWEQFAGS